MRINKYIAQKGYSTRRGADTLIEKGKVFINDKLAKLGENVSEKDIVVVRGIVPKKYTYMAYYKPRNIVTVGANKGKGEKEIKDVSRFDDSIFPIGRLDKDSEGLMIVTNDGRITDHLIGPNSQMEKEYTVVVDHPITHVMLIKIRNGLYIDIGQRKYKTRSTKIRRINKYSFDIVLTEGKNRQIRKMCGSLGYKVTSLQRIRIGKIKLDNLKPNQFKKISYETIMEM